MMWTHSARCSAGAEIPKLIFNFPGHPFMWPLLSYYTKLGFLTTWWKVSKPELFRKENTEAGIPLKGWAWKSRSIIFPMFYCSVRVTGLAQFQRVGKETPALSVKNVMGIHERKNGWLPYMKTVITTVINWLLHYPIPPLTSHVGTKQTFLLPHACWYVQKLSVHECSCGHSRCGHVINSHCRHAQLKLQSEFWLSPRWSKLHFSFKFFKPSDGHIIISFIHRNTDLVGQYFQSHTSDKWAATLFIWTPKPIFLTLHFTASL